MKTNKERKKDHFEEVIIRIKYFIGFSCFFPIIIYIFNYLIKDKDIISSMVIAYFLVVLILGTIIIKQAEDLK